MISVKYYLYLYIYREINIIIFTCSFFKLLISTPYFTDAIFNDSNRSTFASRIILSMTKLIERIYEGENYTSPNCSSGWYIIKLSLLWKRLFFLINHKVLITLIALSEQLDKGLVVLYTGKSTITHESISLLCPMMSFSIMFYISVFYVFFSLIAVFASLCRFYFVMMGKSFTIELWNTTTYKASSKQKIQIVR